MTSVVLGQCDITLANTYYLGKWMSSKKEEERKYAKQISVYFPNQNGRGAHINISGAAVVKHSKNTDNAINRISRCRSRQHLFSVFEIVQLVGILLFPTHLRLSSRCLNEH